MTNLIRKVLIFSTSDGLILQSHSSAEHHKAICVDYRTRQISAWVKPSGQLPADTPRLESHGIIGLINIASLSFLVAIVRREQVAQIYGRSVFCVTDVVLVPLKSQKDANEAIIAANKARTEGTKDSDSEYSDSEDEQQNTGQHEAPVTPTEDDRIFKQQNAGSSSIARDVALRKGSYGKFASEWFSKQVWGASKQSQETQQEGSSQADFERSHELGKEPSATAAAAATNRESHARTAAKQDPLLMDTANASTMSLLPKILRSTKMILSSRSYYFSYDFDLTHRLALTKGKPQSPKHDKLDPLYFWNRRMGSAFLGAGHDCFLIPLVQGFVGQTAFKVKPKVQPPSADEGESTMEANESSTKEFLLTLISRRSAKRSGLRYLRRGIDDEGNCANAAETEQILSSPTWDIGTKIRSFVQVRGSIPLYFSQTPYALKPVPVFHNSQSTNQTAFKRHFQTLRDQYGHVQINMLVNKHGTEATIGDSYERLYEILHDAGQLPDVDFEWFDFHAECRGMKFENVQRLVDKLQGTISEWGETVISGEIVRSVQKGVIRTNCMDCLDRTNVSQSAFGQYVLQHDLEQEGYDIDLLHDQTTNWFNVLWADNGDAISRQYASTAALKGDFTRTRKRNWQGQMNDLGLTLSRYYSNMVNDYFSQAVIDMLLGNVSWKIFEDFESNMMSEDPGISLSSAREAAIDNCAKIVIQGEDEDLVHGWTMLSPAQENTLRTLPFEETVVLLTDTAVYCCKFDWNTEKVASFEKVDLQSIHRIRYGTYITSTFTERQMDDNLNQGLVIVFTPGKEDMIRVNTRSLQNYIAPGTESSGVVDGGTGLLSWFSSKGSSTSRSMALKIIPQEMANQADESQPKARGETPHALAERVSEEIRRAIEGPEKGNAESTLIEKGDIISAADAKRRTGYLEQLGHSLKRMVWA